MVWGTLWRDEGRLRHRNALRYRSYLSQQVTYSLDLPLVEIIKLALNPEIPRDHALRFLA